MAGRTAPPVTTILCPVDFSPHSRAALRFAAWIARATGARITALFVNDPLLVAAAAIKFDQRTLEARSLDELRRFVDRALGPARGGTNADPAVTVRCEQTTGHPGAAILDAVRRVRADLIVMGTEGLSGLRKLFFGSTTHEVVRRTTVPVVIVDRRIAPPAGRWPGTRILVPLDLSRRSEHDAQVAAALAATGGAAITLVHVVAPVYTPPWYSGNGAILNRLRTTRARSRLETIAGGLGYPADVQTTIGPPAETIATLARKQRAQLVVMSVRDGEGLLRARPGSIAYEVVCTARVAVLVLPAHRRRSSGRRARR